MACKWLVLFAIIQSMNDVRSDDFLTEYQTEIEQLPKDLDILILHIEQNVSPESEPSSSLQPIRICVPTSKEYLEIWSIINNFSDEYDNPSITIIQSATCTENDELDKLKMWILKIKNDFNEVLKQQVWSIAYIDVKGEYEHLLTNFMKRMNETDKKVTDKGKNVISKLRTEYQSLESKIRSFFRRMQDKKRLENDKSAERCTLELKAKRIDSALKIFNEISEERIARQIIVSAYENEDSFQMLFDFIQLLQDSAAYYAYQGLMMKMVSKYYWKNINSIIFLTGLEKHKGSEYQPLMNSLQKKLKPMFEAGDYAPFFEAVNTRISGSSDFGKEVIPTFVRGAYNSNTTNVVKILDMRSKFDYMRHKLYLIDSLISEMKIEDHTNKPEFFTVLSDLADLKIEVYKQSNENDKKILNKVYENIPDNLLPLMQPNLCIQNSQTYEYMHAATEATDGRHMFTSITHDIDNTFIFEVEFMERGRTILLKNLRYGEYMYSVDGDAPRKVMLMKGNFKDDKRVHFIIEVIDSLTVRIKNDKFNEFLYSPSESNDRNRLVQSRNQISEDGAWKLTTCKIAK